MKIVYAKHDVSREVEALRACQGHPNIVNLHEVVHDERHTYILMELLSGGELFERIREYRKFTEKEAALFFKQIVQAVQHMHMKDIAHRDLKAENIIFTSRNSTELKIVDFGFAKQNSNSGMTTPCFTLDYAAPEVLVNNSALNPGVAATAAEPYTEASDLWSLGVILYTMLCGQTPFSPKRHPGGPSLATSAKVTTEERVRMIMERIKVGAMETDINEWHTVSELGKGLVRALLTVNPRKRLTMSRLLRHEWMDSNFVTSNGLRHVPLLAAKGDVQCCIKDACRAFEFCLRDELTASNKLVQRRHRRRSTKETKGKDKHEEEEEEEDVVEANQQGERGDLLDRSNSSSGVVTSANSSDVEIVGEYKERPKFQLQKSILGDALAQKKETVRVKREAVVKAEERISPVDSPMDVVVVDSTTKEEATENGIVVRLSTSDEDTCDGAEQIVPEESSPGAGEVTAVAEETRAMKEVNGETEIMLGNAKVAEEVKSSQQMTMKKQVLHYFEVEGAASGDVRRHFRPSDEAFFRGFSEAEGEQERVRLWRIHALGMNASDQTTTTAPVRERGTRKRKRPEDDEEVGRDEKKVFVFDVAEFLARTKAEFEGRTKISRASVTAAMNSGPVERPKSKKINWHLFAERRDMPTRAGKRARRPELDGL